MESPGPSTLPGYVLNSEGPEGQRLPPRVRTLLPQMSGSPVFLVKIGVLDHIRCTKWRFPVHYPEIRHYCQI